MPRQAREKSSSKIYHLMLRGINRQNIFEDDEDRLRFIERIAYYKTISNYELYGYCLMDNHIHLLVREIDESISKAVKRISSSYVYWYNQKYDRLGHLFQERFKSEAVETDEHFLMVLRYIHQNPVKAGITKDMGKYLWSSYREYVEMPIHTDINFALDIFSEDRIKGIQLFQAFMSEKNNDQCLEYKERIKISDKEIIDYFEQLGVANISELQKLEKERRNEIIREIKKVEGVTIRQISRVTGIPKSIVDRA
ncbi:MAG: transposase IS200-family protein [Anaerosolibacter sp.]|jgi:REP element-mobilizing transposase RayT|uniref:transposase n=1 Tax=Anaerosolibacter sp. TaxID=1872527 RepID=UPI00262FCAA9|nr:transposase [Anaerosolibacter sp.]MDF2548759.1 transposase IS200-family protein [Anaerosolibacter sp.]